MAVGGVLSLGGFGLEVVECRGCVCMACGCAGDVRRFDSDVGRGKVCLCF